MDEEKLIETFARMWIKCDPNRGIDVPGSGYHPDDIMHDAHGELKDQPRWKWFIPRARASIEYLRERGALLHEYDDACVNAIRKAARQKDYNESAIHRAVGFDLAQIISIERRNVLGEKEGGQTIGLAKEIVVALVIIFGPAVLLFTACPDCARWLTN